jgi:hypothetical protein
MAIDKSFLSRETSCSHLPDCEPTDLTRLGQQGPQVRCRPHNKGLCYGERQRVSLGRSSRIGPEIANACPESPRFRARAYDAKCEMHWQVSTEQTSQIVAQLVGGCGTRRRDRCVAEEAVVQVRILSVDDGTPATRSFAA